jgi:hypothetical protein
MKKDLKGHNGFKKIDANNQEKKKANNPLTSIFKLKKNDSALAVKGHTPPKAHDVRADGHLGKGSESKHKENPHFPLRKPDNDVE